MKRFLMLAGMAGLMGIQAYCADPLKMVNQRSSEAVCIRFEFLSIIESEIFGTVDTTVGSADLAADGRFDIRLGVDRYLYDLDRLYSHSTENNQVVIEPAEAGAGVADEISFLTRLDELYHARPGPLKGQYSLRRKKDDLQSDLPDSLQITIDPEKLIIEKVEYFDINEDFNRLIILKQTYFDSCEAATFQPDFPDSVERVRLY